MCTGAGAGAALLIKSPAQVAADTAPPPPDILTAEVEDRVISQALITRGKVTASQRTDISSGPRAGEDAGRSVVTKVRSAPGRKLAAGQVLLEVSGRPLFVLEGAVPAYRDLVPGKRGEDVAQLQAALRGSGHPTGNDLSGVFGRGTERALTSLYRSIGYEVPVTEAPVIPAEAPRPDASASPAAKPEEAPPRALPTFPMSEVVFVRSFPAYVEEVRTAVGDEAGENLLSLSSGELTVEGSVTPQEKGMIRAGQKVRIYSDTAGREFSGEVESVALQRATVKDGGEEPGEQKYTVKVTPSRPLPRKLNGENVQLTVVAASSRGKVLAVPSSAVSTGADGLTSVTERTGRKERRIPVTVGVSGDGYVEIVPRQGARLEAGARVVVGVHMRATAGRP
ncbi:HlyD family efflux transporter periplasmic adaptor subunit [Streptomyces hawaiiensis]|uniref:HlyD family efflux transporter periplasmic adaptor subunit n=1 Tax=Streptomyces hawaiiensis TaxID=67305 RepID=UPI001FE93D59|nr:HlyD family efflux transporter periplasmic adaptor subunit [Streptomyces hawaiiensis]